MDKIKKCNINNFWNNFDIYVTPFLFFLGILFLIFEDGFIIIIGCIFVYLYGYYRKIQMKIKALKIIKEYHLDKFPIGRSNFNGF